VLTRIVERRKTMPVLESVRGFFRRPAVLWTLLLLLALGLGIAASFLFIPAPRVALVRFNDVIYGDTAAILEAQLRYAEDDPSIRAVVIEVDSPGGEAAASERLYFDILRLRKLKPVIVMVDSLAASGGYYLASAADLIYATPSSSVGNIGVISTVPAQSFVVEDYLFTGPFKAFGNTRDSFTRQMELLKDSFLQCVFTQRENRLTVDRTTLSRGEIYVGTVAQQMGLVDALGSRGDAAAKAAELAKLSNYTLVDVAAEMVARGALQPTPTPVAPTYFYTQLQQPDWQPGYYYLYIAPQEGGVK
jgi:protease-4